RPPSFPLFPYTTLFRSAGDGVPAFEPIGGPALGELPEVRRHVVSHETPRQPGEEQVDHAVAHEEELCREPAAQVGTRLVQPAERSEEHTSELQSRVDLV